MTGTGQDYLHTPSAVLSDGIVPVPLWAVTQLVVDSTFAVPQIGGTSQRVALPSHDDTLTLTCLLLGEMRFTWKLMLENMAEASRRGTALSSVSGGQVGGLILLTSLTIRTDLAVASLTITASAARRNALDVVLRLVHLPRVGTLGALLDLAAVGVGALSDALPDRLPRDPEAS